MANLPSNRTKLNVAIANQQPSIVASSQANREALVEAYDTIDLLNQKADGLVAGGLLVPFPPAGVSRQALINGNFDFWQRGTSMSGTGYIADRWRCNQGAGATVVVSQRSFAAGQPDVPNNPTFYAQVDYQVPGSAPTIFTQRIEDVRTLSNSQISYGFWAKVASGNFTLGVLAVQNFGSGGSASASSSRIDHQLTTSWKYFSGTLNNASLSGKTIGAGSFLDFEFRIDTAQSAAQVHIAQVQLNAGSVALPYQPMHPAVELALCQRYCIAYTDTSGSFTIGHGYANATTSARIFVPLPCALRVKPSLVATGADWQLTDSVGAGIDIIGLTIDTSGSNPLVVALQPTVASGLTQYRPYRMFADGTGGRLLIFDAEL